MSMRGGQIIFTWLLAQIAAAAMASGQSGFPPPATFAPPPRRTLSDQDVLPEEWSYSRSLTSGAHPAAVISGNPAGEASQAFDLRDEDWWTVFRDPELDQLERVAIDANQDMQRAITRVMQSRLQARIIAADFFPHFDMSGDHSRSVSSDDNAIIRNSVYGGNSGEIERFLNRSVTQNVYEAALRMSWEVDVFGRIHAAYAAGQARAEATFADARGVRLSVTTELATDYFALRTADEQVAILNETAALRREALSLNQARTAVGIGLPDDVARARLELDNVEAQLADVVRQRHELQNDLALLCGQPAPDFQVTVRSLRDIALPDKPRVVPAVLLTRRPDVQAAERRLTATLQDLREARAEELPRVTISGFIGQEAVDFDHFSNTSSHEAAIMPVISIPIFEAGRNEANVRLASAQRDEAAADYRETVLTAFREADTALDDMRQRAVQSAAQERSVGDAQEVLNFSNDRFVKRTVSYFQVVTDEANLLATQLQAALVRNARFAAAVSLARVLGGGWIEVAGPSSSTRGSSSHRSSH